MLKQNSPSDFILRVRSTSFLENKDSKGHCMVTANCLQHSSLTNSVVKPTG